eukprot:13907290-Alexandrium_andersonii.AAC.1
MPARSRMESTCSGGEDAQKFHRRFMSFEVHLLAHVGMGAAIADSPFICSANFPALGGNVCMQGRSRCVSWNSSSGSENAES